MLGRELDRAYARGREIGHDPGPVRARGPVLDQGLVLDPGLGLERVQEHGRDHGLELGRGNGHVPGHGQGIALDLGRGLGRERGLDLGQDLARASHVIVRVLGLGLGRGRDLGRGLGHGLGRDRGRGMDSAKGLPLIKFKSCSRTPMRRSKLLTVASAMVMASSMASHLDLYSAVASFRVLIVTESEDSTWRRISGHVCHV